MKKRSTRRASSADTPIIQMLYDAVPGPKAQEDPAIGGAWITAYIRESDVSVAVLAELKRANRAGWRVLSIDHARPFDGKIPKEEPHKSAFEEALRSGNNGVFHCYPPEKTPALKTPKKAKKKSRPKHRA